MRLRWRRRAINQLFSVYRFIAKRNPSAAQTMLAEIEGAALQLKQFPRLGHPGERIGVFELQVPGTPYLLPYRIVGDVIEILSVFDQRRNPEDKL